MKRNILLILSVFTIMIAKSQVVENFTDGDYTNAPIWTLNSPTDFTVNAGQLKSTNITTPGNFYISTTNTLATNCQWEFWVNLQFATSSTNYADIYLTSDVPNLQATSINGYFVRLGGTLDEICLFKRSGLTSSSIKIVDGADAVISSSSNNLIKIKVTRTTANLFKLERDMTGLGTSYATEGTVTDAAFTNSNSFGFLVQQSTASFVGKHFFDDIIVGPIILDLTPPTLVNATAISATAIDVLFNENVDLITAEVISNYAINSGIGLPASATRDAVNFKLVHLITTPSLVSGNTYTVVVNNVQDLAGNALSNLTISFSYFVFGTPNFKDLVISEIFADPSPVINLTSCEFIEIYNRSANPFNLSGLKFTDNTSLATLGNYTLVPNGYVIICPMVDTAQFTTLGYMNKLGVSSFPSLTNAGKGLYIKTALGAFIDSVNYSDTWYKNSVKKDGGYTLEQINPNLIPTCSQASNWIASNDTDGGTPGFVNSVYSIALDVVGPKISNITVLDSTRISICFNDLIASSQLTVTSNYIISGSIGSPTLAVANSGNTCVIISLPTKLINATNYTITITGITDCASNTITPNTGLISYYKPKAYDVVFNELMPDPDPGINLPVEEYVELKNRTPFKINMKDWSISTLSTSKKLPAITIEPDSFIVLTGTGNALTFGGFGILAYEVVSMPSLLNDGTTLTLRDSNGVVINSISYSSSWYNNANKKDGGWSLELIDANNPCGGQDNWRASNNVNGGSPGKRNSVVGLNPDNTAPLLDRITVVTADTIILFFNESLDSISLKNPLIYSFDNGLTTPLYVLPIGSEFKKVKLKLSSPISFSTVYTCFINGSVKDCAGNSIQTGSSVLFGLPVPPLPNDVIINEVLFDPTTPGIDFVELYNRSNRIIDLKDLRIGSMDTLAGTLINTEKITEEGFLLFPETYVVLSESGVVVKRQYQTMNPKGFLDIADLPSMNTGGDVITLSDKNAVVIDNFTYSSKMHFPLLISTKGVSLERIDYNRKTNDKTNWNSAAQAIGFATPAYKNSQYLQADGGSGVTITNPLFSPDNDGYNDVLNISYLLDEIGKVANIFIYDSKGRQVKHLTRNEQLPSQGVISWNGNNDENEKAPIGIYVVYVELFNLSGKLNKYKLPCTLAGKL